jgi:programmed cell death 6-interacting protein
MSVFQIQQPACACRLCKQVTAFYDEVKRELLASPLNQHFDKSWLSHVAVKSVLYETEAQVH